MADMQLPEGWMALPGGQVYNPSTNQILTDSQAANLFGVSNANVYTTPQTPAAPPTPTYAMDAQGNIGAGAPAADVSGMMYAAQGLASGYNPNSGMPEPTTMYGGRQYTLSELLQAIQNPQDTTLQQPATPTPGQPAQSINWLPSANQGMLNTALMTQGPPTQISPPAGLQDIRNQVNPNTQSFQTPSPISSGTTMFNTNSGGMNSTSNFPQQRPWDSELVQPPQPYATVQDTSAWRAAPTAMTALQQGGRGMLYS